MPARQLISLVLIVCSASQATVSKLQGAQAPSTALPNILIILVDDLGWTDLACYGSDLHETPHIDQLARQSMRFTNAYAAASICSPTRASILTGKYPARLNMTIWHEGAVRGPSDNPRRKMLAPNVAANLSHQEVTIAEVLKSIGYVTAHVGKWHLGTAAYYPETQGFDVNVGGTFWGAPATFFHPYRGLWPGSQELRYVPGLALGSSDEYLTDRLTDEALKIIESCRDQSFFLNMCYHTVHTPIEGKRELVAYYDKKVKPNMQHRHATYASMVHSFDQNVGRILQALDRLQIADRTVIILTSDNGGLVSKSRWGIVTDNSPLRSGKGSLYEGGIRVPLIIHWPGVTQPGSVGQAMVSTQDFYPTILDMIGESGDQDHNADVDGVVLSSVLKDPSATLSRNTLFWHYPHYYPTTSPVSAIRTGHWKLLEYFEDTHVELYNLEDDVGEKHDLAATMPDRANQLRGQLSSWRESVDAQLPRPNPSFKK